MREIIVMLKHYSAIKIRDKLRYKIVNLYFEQLEIFDAEQRT